jgi:hypothetical protein
VTCNDGYTCIYGLRAYFLDINYCYLINTAKTSTGSKGVTIIQGSHAYVLSTYFSNNYFAIFCNSSAQLTSNTNDDTGTLPNFGLRSETNGTIGKANSQPAGSMANESLAQGGQIF